MSVTKYEAFFEHVETCTDCCWVTGELCTTGRSMLAESAQRAAQVLAPIPVVLPRPKAKA